ncbi:MAG: hypothetical protein ACP5SH_08715 [Syntrophobacteraceae bacterium]
MRVIVRFLTVPVMLMLMAAFLWSPIARADVLEVSGSGMWLSNAPTTAFSAANESWSFSFDVTNPINIDYTAAVTNFTYTLAGEPVSGFTSIQFYPDPVGGFDLTFGSGDIVNMYGQAVTDLNSPPNLVPGTYAYQIDVNSQAVSQTPSVVYGSGTVDVSSVPEPSSFYLMGCGLLFLLTLGAFLRKRQENYSEFCA